MFTVTQNGTWALNAASYAAGVTTGTLSGVVLRFSAGNACTFVTTGSVPATYTNSTHVLALNSSAANLVVNNVTEDGNLGVNDFVDIFGHDLEMNDATSALCGGSTSGRCKGCVDQEIQRS